MKTTFLYAHRCSIPLLTAACLASALTATAATETWDDRFGVPNLNNQLFALDVSASETVAIGGSFSGNSAGNPGALNANKVALWNGASWSALGTGPDHGPGGTVHAVKWLGNDLYVGGEFPGANNLPANHLIRWDGNSWHPLVAGGVTGLNGSVHALATAGDHLYVAGRFTTAGPVVANCIARWDGTTWSAMGGGISGGATPVVTALAVAPDGSVYVGGMFTSASGVPAVNIARWDGSSWSALGTGITGPGAAVRAIVIAPNGDVVVGGNFTTAGGQPAQSLARWNGSTWQEVGGGVQEGEVLALAYDGDDLWVGGTFAKANTYIVPYLGVLQNGIWQIPGIQGVNGEVRQIVVRPSGVYLVGFFQSAGDRTGLLSMAKWDRTQFVALHRGFLGYPYDISAAGTNVVAVGDFATVGGRPAKGVARWDGNDWQLLGTPQASGVTPPQTILTALALPNGETYVGGSFSQVGGMGAWSIAKWTGSEWQNLGDGLQAGGNTRVDAIVQLPDGSIIAGGIFLNAGGQPVNNIARWDGDSWSALADGLHTSADVNRGHVIALAWAGDRLYAGGNFDRSGALEVNSIAWWDGLNWHALDGGVTYQGSYGSVQAVAVHGFEVFVGGAISQAGSVPASWIARWQPGTGWSALGAGLDSGPDALLAHGGTLYVAGNFNNSGGELRPGLAGWDGSNWHTVGGGLVGLGPYANSLAASGTNLYIGGGFDGAGSVISSRFARLNLTNAPPSVAWLTPVPDAILPNATGIILEIDPTDEDGSIASVEFFVESSAIPLATVNAAPWKFTWDGAATGSHRLAARVTDNSGATTWTPVRRVEVLPPGGNAPPQVAITSPESGSTFKATPDRLLIANATDADGDVVQVDFYSSNVPLGTATTAPWQIIWPDLQAGVYPLRAVAWDNSGAKATSVVANVTVLPPNSAPYLEINDIYEGTVMEDPGTLTLRANSSDGDGGLTSVEFFVNGPRVAHFTTELDRWHYEYLWDPVPPGAHTFRVVATDTDGATTERLVNFTVTPFNQPPLVTLHGPADGSSLGMPNSIPLLVEASDPDGEVVEVRWLSGEAVLGSKTNTPWVFNLRNLAAADYYLRAQAIDNLGKSSSTPPVTITVTNDPAAQPRYRLVELTPPGGDEGEAYDINQLGQVSATLRNGDSNTRGYRYFDGTYLDLGDTLSPRHPFALYCTGINDLGTVAGFGHINGREMAFTWQNNTLTELGVLGESFVSGVFSRGRAINNLGHVVGGSRNSNGVDRAFLYRDGQLTDLGGLGPTLDQSEAFDLNDQDEVVGWVMGSAGRRAFIYDPVNGMRDLSTFGDSQESTATGINAHGQVVGSYQDQNNRARAFLWSGGIEVQLGTFGGESEAHDINDPGQIVGTANIEGYGPSAFLWQGCALFNLNRSITNANWHLVAANAINNAGWIVGWGRKDFQSQRRAFLLIPDDSAGPVQPYSPITFHNGRFQMCVPVPPGTTYRLDASGDLKNWTAISTNYVPEGVLDFRDPEADEHPTRFYRAVLLP